MKKFIFFFTILLLPITLIGQDKFIEVNWNDTKSQKNTVNDKNSERLIRLLINQDMNFIKQWEDINYVDENSLEIS